MFVECRTSNFKGSIDLQEIITPEVLYEEVIEVNCRVTPTASDRCRLPPEYWKRKVTGKTKEELYVVSELNVEKLKENLLALKQKGINSVAVVLMHSYT